VGYEDLSRGIDWVTAQMFYPAIGGVVISGGWHHPKAFPFSMEYTVVGDCGTIEFDSAGVPPTLYRADGEKQQLTLPDADGYQAELEYFVACCVSGRQPEFCPPRESAAAVKLAMLMDESRRRKGDRVQCGL
jgi:predicted dehydrogenase